MLVETLMTGAGAVIALALLWRRSGRRSPARTKAGAQRGRARGDYRCVEVRARGKACGAVRQLAGKRFLPDEAPRFPVSGCNAARCSCRYVHYADRRHAERRNLYGQRSNEPPPGVFGERRFVVDRRTPSDIPFRPAVRR